MARDGPRAGGRLTVIEKLRNIVEWWGSRKFVMGAKNKTEAHRRCAAMPHAQKQTPRLTCSLHQCHRKWIFQVHASSVIMQKKKNSENMPPRRYRRYSNSVSFRYCGLHIFPKMLYEGAVICSYRLNLSCLQSLLRVWNKKGEHLAVIGCRARCRPAMCPRDGRVANNMA